MINSDFWKNKKVFLTGHTGFKGSWLSIWLHYLGAEVTGYALTPPTEPNLFSLCRIDEMVRSKIADIRDSSTLATKMSESGAEVVIHMAAQSLVLNSYRNPAETYGINVMGTVNLFETVRKCSTVKAVINVTSDKCYENREWVWGYRENEPLGGYDPYASSKACSELVTAAYRNSFFNPEKYDTHGMAIASARAGNVIGGGDWADDRLIPDCIRALLKGDKIVIRNPKAIRPWQHMLEPLRGYLLLAQKLYEEGADYCGGWNFGPDDHDARPVEWLAERLCSKWGQSASYRIDTTALPHEAHYLKLDCSKAKSALGWHPRWNLEKALDSIIEWTKAYQDGKDLTKVCLKQIEEYSTTSPEA
jgi:CDP-glucose 4,6-dehydratase